MSVDTRVEMHEHIPREHHRDTYFESALSQESFVSGNADSSISRGIRWLRPRVTSLAYVKMVNAKCKLANLLRTRFSLSRRVIDSGLRYVLRLPFE